MHISVVGIDHRKAPVLVREKVAITAEKLPGALSSLACYVPHGLILSTCNRTEIYAMGPESVADQNSALKFFQSRTDLPAEELMGYASMARDEEATEHLFRVAGGLESMVVGEHEVLGQVRMALEAAEKAGSLNAPLRRLFRDAIRAGRRVRDETGISQNSISISSIAVDLAASIVGDLKSSRILVIGAGEAGRLVVKVARERGAAQIVVASRTREKAEALASQLGGRPIGLVDLGDELCTANMVISCASAPHYILDADQIRMVMRSRPDSPLVLIDIAVPRNVDPAVRQIENVHLFDIDDFNSISNSNRKQREGEVEKASIIISEEVAQSVAWLRALEAEPVVGALMNKAENIRKVQLEKTLKRLPPLSEEEREKLDSMTKAIVTRILNCPVQYVRTNINSDKNCAEMVNKLFGLEEGSEQV
jgi:glutamyl-tRNA reductase